MPPISVMIKPVSGSCNMACDYCFYCDEMKQRTTPNYGQMSEETLKMCIRRTMLTAQGSISYAFQGGEPTLRGLDFFRKAVAFQKQYNKNNILIHNAIQTNATLLDDEWCVFFKENDFLVGVSLDGPAYLHDRYRHFADGRGSFEAVQRGIACLEKHGVAYNILTVVTEDLAKEIDAVYAFYKRNGWHYQQYIACMDPLNLSGRPADELTWAGPQSAMPYSLTPESYGVFLTKLFRLWYEDRQKGCAPHIRQFENMLAMAAGYLPEACDQRGCCSVQYAVEADGSVYPCDFYMTDAYRLGNVHENKMREIDQARERLQFIEESRRKDAACKSCAYYALCKGGCKRYCDWDCETESYINKLCKGYQAFFAACIEILEREGRAVLA